MQPLSLIDIVLDNRANKTFQYIRESSPTSLLNTVPYDPIKNSIALFLSEILHKTLRESDKENALFDFVKESILFFDTTTKGFANFHLVFLIKMTYFLGFFPNLSQFHDGVYFDMLNSQFTEQNNNPHTLNIEETEAFAHLMRMDYDNMQIFSLSRNQRNTILEHILTYYRLHLPEFGTVKSLDILQQLFA
jgi:DNA repair protein RecO (recombination protein O)